MNKPRRHPDAASLNPSLASRTPEELAADPEFRERIQGEFGASPGMDRRDFLRLLGGTIGLAGLAGATGCGRMPRQKFVPYVNQPENLVPGKPLFYATALEFRGFARGVLVETHEGRPTKIEGNPLHPSSLGATSVFEQAAILDLYNPARSSAELHRGEPSTWGDFLGALQKALAGLPSSGEGLRVLTGTMTSPSFGAVWNTLRRRYPAAQWHRYEPINDDNAFDAARAEFGRPVTTHWRFDQAHAVVSFGADFLFDPPGSLRYARDLMTQRDVRSGRTAMNRIYMLESVPSITGVYADDRRAVPGRGPDGMTGHAAALARALGVPVATPGWEPGANAIRWGTRVAAELRAARGPCAILAGRAESVELHRFVHRMNAMLPGGAVMHTSPVELDPVNQSASLHALAEDLDAGRVRVLLLLDGDWARTAPADLGLASLIGRAPFSVHLGLYRNETSDAALWHIPQTHPLEAWSDSRADDGTTGILQPLIEPLFGGRTALELLDCVAGFPGRRSYEILRSHWFESSRLVEESWLRALHDGVIPNTAEPEITVAPVASGPVELHAPTAEGALELRFTPDYSLWDGRYSENAWLQELPRPINRLSWENALCLAPDTARQHGLESGDVVRLRSDAGRTLRAPVLVQPGMAEGVLAVALGHGARPEPGVSWLHPESAARAFSEIGRNAGVNAYPVRTAAHPWQCGVTLEKIRENHTLVTTQPHQIVARTDLVRAATASELPAIIATAREHEPPTLYNLTRKETDGIAWAMVIDLSRCIGCNACVLACQSENNIPPVGRHEVGRGREMHWLRVDAYYFGAPERPSIAFQPVPCMHCETAPCELVCPVEATVHDHEGLNLQVYNRCIGTRYCSNNCPYKVRRFNFFNYGKPETQEPVILGRNPHVTIRSRGVMEKCTYCIQRISEGRIRAEIEKRAIRDGEVIPACAQACPTETIIFGDRNDPAARVARLKHSPLDFSLLGEENTRPRTTYLRRITNPIEGHE